MKGQDRGGVERERSDAEVERRRGDIVGVGGVCAGWSPRL